MSVEIDLQALPADWPLLERVRKGVDSYQLVTDAMYLFFLRRNRFASKDLVDFKSHLRHVSVVREEPADYQRMANEAVELMETRPEVVWTHADLDKSSYRWMHPVFLTLAARSKDLKQMAHTIYGRDNIRPHDLEPIRWDAEGAQPVRWNNVETTWQVANGLESIVYADLQTCLATENPPLPAHCTSDYMEGRAERDEHYFDRIKECYRVSAREGLVVVKRQTY